MTRVCRVVCVVCEKKEKKNSCGPSLSAVSLHNTSNPTRTCSGISILFQTLITPREGFLFHLDDTCLSSACENTNVIGCLHTTLLITLERGKGMDGRPHVILP